MLAVSTSDWLQIENMLLHDLRHENNALKDNPTDITFLEPVIVSFKEIKRHFWFKYDSSIEKMLAYEATFVDDEITFNNWDYYKKFVVSINHDHIELVPDEDRFYRMKKEHIKDVQKKLINEAKRYVEMQKQNTTRAIMSATKNKLKLKQKITKQKDRKLYKGKRGGVYYIKVRDGKRVKVYVKK